MQGAVYHLPTCSQVMSLPAPCILHHNAEVPVSMGTAMIYVLKMWCHSCSSWTVTPYSALWLKVSWSQWVIVHCPLQNKLDWAYGEVDGLSSSCARTGRKEDLPHWVCEEESLAKEDQRHGEKAENTTNWRCAGEGGLNSGKWFCTCLGLTEEGKKSERKVKGKLREYLWDTWQSWMLDLQQDFYAYCVLQTKILFGKDGQF